MVVCLICWYTCHPNLAVDYSCESESGAVSFLVKANKMDRIHSRREGLCVYWGDSGCFMLSQGTDFF